MLLVLPDELEILRDMRPLDRDVFNYLSERVDYESGVIGRSRRVSYGGMALDLSERDVARRVKSTLLKLTSIDIENSVKRLVKAGLLERLSKSGIGCALILKRVYWVSLYSSVQNPVARQMLGELLGFIKNKTTDNNELDNKKESSCEVRFGSVATTSLQHTTYSAGDKFLMNLDWQPDNEELKKILALSGHAVENINPAWVSEFISYWYAEGERALTQRQWTVKLARLLEDYLLHPGLFEKRHGISKPVETPGFKNLTMPDWAVLPRDDMRLVSWMRKFGYGDPPAGLDYKQARAYVQRQVDVRLGEWKRGLS